MAGAPLAVLAGEMLPHSGEHGTPYCLKVQVTPAPAPPFAPSFITVAVSISPAFTVTVAGAAETDTEMDKSVIFATLDAPVLVTEIAWIYTPTKCTVQLVPQEPRVGGVKCAGAVYVVGPPLAVFVAETVPQLLHDR